MIIRDYKPDDCVLLAQLFYDTIHTINAMDYTKEQLDVWATGDVNLEEWNRSFLEHTTLVAVQAGAIVGFADMDRNGCLDRLFVHKDYQSMGIATGLVKELERCVEKNNVVCFETYASITARSFFEQLGYVMQTENTVVREGVSLTNFRMTKVVSDY
ncbi:GNAT family N-acetyltransferase [Clostridium sp. LBM24168]